MTVRGAAVIAVLCFPPQVLPAQGQAPSQARRVRVAILDFRAEGVESRQTALLSGVALGEATRLSGIEAMGRSNIAAVLGVERERRLTGNADDVASLEEIGGALDVDHLLVGSLSRSGSGSRLNVRLVDPRSARTEVESSESIEGDDESLAATTRRLVHRLLDPLAGRAADGALLVTPPVVLTVEPAETWETAVAPMPPEGRSRRRWTLVCAGAGVGLSAAGAVFGAMARSAYDAERRASRNGDLAAYTSNRSAAKSRALIADVLFVAGAVGFGAGAYLHFTGRDGAGASLAAAPVPGGAVAMVGGGF